MPPTPPPSSSNCSSDSEGGGLSPERSAPPSPSPSPYFTRTHLSFHTHSSSSHHHSSLWTSSQSSGQQALFTSPVRATTCTLGIIIVIKFKKSISSNIKQLTAFNFFASQFFISLFIFYFYLICFYHFIFTLKRFLQSGCPDYLHINQKMKVRLDSSLYIMY